MDIPIYAKLKAEEPYVGPENVSEIFQNFSLAQIETNVDKIIEKINSKKIRCTANGCTANVSIVNQNCCQHCDGVYCVFHRPMLNHDCEIDINKTPRRFPITFETIKEARERAADLMARKKAAKLNASQMEKKKVLAVDDIMREYVN